MDTFELRMRLIDAMTRLEYPVVFKGCTVLRASTENLGVGVRVGTKDLDMDWVSGEPTMSELRDSLDDALALVDSGLHSESFREFASNRAAGFRIVNSSGDNVFSVDIQIGVAPHGCWYKTDAGVSFIGSTLDKIFSDKLAVASQRTILRRPKDLFDLYVLSHIDGFSTDKARATLSERTTGLGDFTYLLYDTAMVRHGYDKLKGVVDKPPFEAVYADAIRFIQPFIDKNEESLIWRGRKWTTDSSR